MCNRTEQNKETRASKRSVIKTFGFSSHQEGLESEGRIGYVEGIKTQQMLSTHDSVVEVGFLH